MLLLVVILVAMNSFIGPVLLLNCSTDPFYPMQSNGVTDEDKKTVLDLHNKYRNTFAAGNFTIKNGNLPPAANMEEMVWDDALAAAAKVQGETCVMEHYLPPIPSGEQYGQNLFAVYACEEDLSNSHWDQAIKDFSGESINFPKENFKPFKTDSSSGHFSQLYWPTSKKLGCNRAVWELDVDEYTFMYTCNYGPQGNIDGAQSFYQEGKPCSQCKNGCSKTHPNLCA